MKRAAIVALIIALCAAPIFAQSFALDETSDNYSFQGIGLNIGTNDYYEQISAKNLAGVNPGFQPQLANMTVTVTSGATATTFTDTNSYDFVYANQFAGGTYLVACHGGQFSGSTQVCTGGTDGETGDITSNTAATEGSSGATFTVTGLTTAPSANDTIFVFSNPAASTPSSLWNFNGLGWTGTYSIITTSGELAPNTVQCASLSSGEYVETYEDTASDGPNVYITNGDTWEQSISAIQISGSGTLTASVLRSGSGGQNSSHEFTTGGSGYQTYSYTFTGTETAPSSESIQIEWAYSGTGSVCLNNAQVYDTSDTADSYFRGPFITAVKTTMDLPEIRYSWPVNGETLANLTNDDSGSRFTAAANGGASNPGYVVPLDFDWYNVLRAAAANGVTEAWLNVPLTMMTATDATNISDYLCGGSDTTYGAIRIAQGQTTPWCDVFSRTVIELGNEAWNGASGNQYLPLYSVGANSAWNYVPMGIAFARELKAAASWNSSAMKTAMGVQTANAGFWAGVIHTDDTTSAVDIDSINGYTQTYATTCDTQDLYQSAATEAWANSNDSSSQSGFYQTANVSGFLAGVYEYQNNSYSPNTTCTNAQLVGFAEGEGYTVANTLQPLLAAQKFGMQDFNFFVLYQNSFGGNAIWGIETGPGGSHNNPRPSAYALGMVNACTKGGTGYAATGSSIPTFDFTAMNGVNAQASVPLLNAFAFKNGISRCAIVENADYSDSHTFSFTGSNVPTGTVTVSTLTASATTTSNESALNVEPSTTTVSNPSSFTLAPHSMATYTWTVGGAAGGSVLTDIELTGGVTVQ